MDHDNAVRTLAVERYLLSEMAPSERDMFEEHYFECVECGENLRATSRFLEDAKQVWTLDNQTATPAAAPVRVPQSTASSWTWLSWLQPQLAAPALAALLAVVGYQALRNSTLKNELQDVGAPHIVRTVALRPLTRGDATTLVVAQGESLVLQFDLPEPVLSPQLEIRSESDNAVLSIRGEQLRGEQPLDLTNVVVSIPKFNLPPGRYNLSVRTSGREVARYPLEVKN